MLLTFQLNKENNSLEILFDKEGHKILKAILNKDWKEPIPKENGLFDLDHEHLMSEEWAGSGLTPEYTSKDMKPIHAVKIAYLGEKGIDLFNG